MVTGTNSNSTMSSTATSMATSTGPAEMATSTTTRRLSDNRRSNKPIMEKRRRARINNCLNELKSLILDAMKKDPARHSKLEKADILEMTVKHLQTLQRQQVAMSAATDPTIVNKFRAGFNECASEVGKFPGLDPIIKRRLLQHLANCLNAQNNNNNNNTKAVTEIPQVQVHILPNTATAAPVKLIDHPQNGGIILSNGNGVQLVPTRLPNGDIALVLPNTNTPPAQQVPLLVPIMPERTSSTASAASTSSYSPSHSPEPILDNNFNQRKPLSLVVRKDVEMEEKPWRPW